MHCKVLCIVITEPDLVLLPKNHGFLKTELLRKPNFRGGPEAVRFSQIILYMSPTGPNKYLRGITPTKTDKLKLDLF